MAAMWSLDIEKQLGAETWTNRYILSNPSIESALLTAAAIWPIEQTVHLSVVTFTRYRISDLDPSTDLFVIVPIGEVGGVVTTEQYLPLFNVARIDFPAGTGRPSRKYLRLPILESVQENGVLSSAFIASMNTNYGSPLGDIDEFVDVDGEPLGDGICQVNVGMRQLRRGSKRRATPVLG